MKNLVIFFSAAVLVAAPAGFAAAGQKKATSQAPAIAAARTNEEAGVKELKDTLYKLVRQDESLDGAIAALTAPRAGAKNLAAVSAALKTVSNDLRYLSARNEKAFAAIQPGSGLTRYTNAILSYSRKLDRKSARVAALAGRMAGSGRKAGMRDAVASGRTGKKARGRTLTQMLAQRQALKKLALDARELQGASRGLNAISKWLYIASK